MPSADYSSSARQWTLVLVLTALLLSLVVLGQILARYGSAYMAAPHEVTAFVDSVDSSVLENESYDRDVAKVPRLEDKIRLGRLLREIQKSGDDLREVVNGLLVPDDGGGGAAARGGVMREKEAARLRMSARLLWASRRAELEERLRRLDLLRMRFLVVYMSIVAATATAAAEKVEKSALLTPSPSPPRDPERGPHGPGSSPFGWEPPASPVATMRAGGLPAELAEGIKRKPPLRRLTTQATPPSARRDTPETNHRQGWVGVVAELQRSPLLHKRHASIEMSMAAVARTP